MRLAGSVPAALVVPAALQPAMAADAGATRERLLTRQDFEALIDQSLSITKWGDAPGAPAQIRLVAVADVPHCQNALLSFTALFEHAGPAPIKEAVWQLSHPSLGQQAVLLSPNDAEGRVIEAVFHRG